MGGMIWEGLRCQRGSTAPLLSMGCGTAATSIRRCNICIISGVAEVSSSMRLLRAVRCLVPLFRATIFRATLPSATVLRPETSLRCQGAQTWIQLLCDGNESACEWCRACLLFDSYVIRMYANFQALSHSAVNEWGPCHEQFNNGYWVSLALNKAKYILRLLLLYIYV